MWEQSFDNEIAEDNLTSLGETAVRVGEIEWQKDDSTVGDWNDGEINQVYEELGERSQGGGCSRGGRGKSRGNEKIGGIPDPFLDWLQCHVSNEELGPDPEGAEEC
ncbi:unnamed protein product [Gordionus sp. m RMFG-2023]